MAGKFSLILVLVTLASGLIWLIDAKVFAPRRRKALQAAEAAAGGELDSAAREQLSRRIPFAETGESIFPVLAIVLILRSFIYEPFQIPSGSMMPTLLVGDFILVEKFAYGIKDPIWRSKLIETGEPKRGDIAVFKYPVNPELDYIKRVVGLPGDKIIYRNKSLYIEPACPTGEQCEGLKKLDTMYVSSGEFAQMGVPLNRYTQRIGELHHDILINPMRGEPRQEYFPRGQNVAGEWVVPEGHYFMMGDNRDNSTDSRFWGFVSEDELVGRAVAIWISLEFERGEGSVLPGWVPTGVRFERVGGIQ